MKIEDLNSKYISESLSTEIANRQLLSFLRIPVDAGPNIQEPKSKSGFNIENLPEGDRSGVWIIREIHDVYLTLLFRDHIIRFDNTNEIRVRVASNDLLMAPVWSVKAGPIFDLEAYSKKAQSYIEEKLPDLKLIFLEDERIPIICYSYPKMGLLCESIDSGMKTIVDIADYTLMNVEDSKLHDDPENNTVWSPFDLLNNATIGQFGKSWKDSFERLPKFSAEPTQYYNDVATANESIIEEKTVKPELNLVGQKSRVFCAVATAEMILEHHGLNATQEQISIEMKTGRSGTTNQNQVVGYESVSKGLLNGIYDRTASFSEAKDEIRNNRPFKSGITGHARACGGYKIESENKMFLYIYDPWPPEIGEVYYEDWSTIFHTNYIYVRPELFR